jgi:hypothetical protein
VKNIQEFLLVNLNLLNRRMLNSGNPVSIFWAIYPLRDIAMNNVLP